MLFKNGLLTIQATNSGLAEILHDITNVTGMAVGGPIPGQRVFGVYGPGDPREVLTQLLTGFGYNYMLIGTGAAGMPRQLVLSLPSGGAASSTDSSPGPEPRSVAAASVPTSTPSIAFRQETSAATQAPEGTDAAPDNSGGGGADGEPLGPGAIADVPPNESDQAQDPSNSGSRVQQNMQRLQAMQEAQSAQQGSPQ